MNTAIIMGPDKYEEFLTDPIKDNSLLDIEEYYARQKWSQSMLTKEQKKQLKERVKKEMEEKKLDKEYEALR